MFFNTSPLFLLGMGLNKHKVTAVFIALIWLSMTSAYSKPPKFSKFKQHVGNVFLLNKVSRFVLIEYSKGLISNIDELNESGKNDIMMNYKNGTSAVILYEFASGLGPSTRYFYDDHPFTQNLKTGPGVKWFLNSYLNGYDSFPTQLDTIANVYNLRYQFSPLYYPFVPKTWGFGIKQHCKTLANRNLSQFVLGSFNADITYLDSNTVQLHIWNLTSKKSLFWGVANRIQRPHYFGTTKQHIYMSFTINELDELLK
ncbi:MAG: hypothetical protein ACI8ZN_001778 [Bacteroidia bacterium]